MTLATRPQDTRFAIIALAIFAGSAIGVSRLQPCLAEKTHAVKDADDVYLFPPPSELRIATLGYVAATVDILWGTLLVQYGTHWGEHRSFPSLEQYLDALVGLD